MKYIIKYSPIISLFTLLFAIGIHTPQFLQISTFIIIAEDAATLFIMSTGIFFVITFCIPLNNKSMWPSFVWEFFD